MDLEVSFQSKNNKLKSSDVFKLVEKVQKNGLFLLWVRMDDKILENSPTPPSINNVIGSPYVELVGEWVEIKPTYDEKKVPFNEWQDQEDYYMIQLKLPPLLGECKKTALIADVGWLLSFAHPDLVCSECDSLPCKCPQA